MGNWISSYFHNEIELAADVRNEYVDFLEAGDSGREATRHVIASFSEELEDKATSSIVWTALAITQWKYGRLEPRIKAKAIKAIEGGGCFPEELETRRERVLANIRAGLESPQPTEKPVRIKAAPPRRKNEKLWNSGQVISFRCDDGRFALLLAEVVTTHPFIGQIPTFIVLQWRGKRVPQPERISQLAVTDLVISVYPNEREPEIPWDRIRKIEATHNPSGLVRKLGGGVYCPTGFSSCAWSELNARL